MSSAEDLTRASYADSNRTCDRSRLSLPLRTIAAIKDLHVPQRTYMFAYPSKFVRNLVICLSGEKLAMENQKNLTEFFTL